MAPTSYLAAFLLIIFVLMDFSCGLKCFLDTRGIYPPEDGTPVNTSEFRVFDCNLLGGDQKVCFYGILDKFLCNLRVFKKISRAASQKQISRA